MVDAGDNGREAQPRLLEHKFRSSIERTKKRRGRKLQRLQVSSALHWNSLGMQLPVEARQRFLWLESAFDQLVVLWAFWSLGVRFRASFALQSPSS